MHDSVVLQALAKELTQKSGCSWNPLDYWHCAVAVAEAVWHWIQHWGHLVLDILSLATFIPPPFTVIGVAAAATNATWYAIEGDYVAAGLVARSSSAWPRLRQDRQGREGGRSRREGCR